MDPAEYLAHLDDYRRDPWGSRAVVTMLAQVCAILCNVNRGKDSRPFEVADFLPGVREQAPIAPTTFSDLMDTLKDP